MTEIQRHSANSDGELLEDLNKIELMKDLFEEHALQKTSYRRLGEKFGLSPNTVKKYIGDYRERLATDLKTIGQQHLSEIYTQLDWLFMQAKQSWEAGNADVALLTLMRSVLKDKMQIFGIDKPDVGGEQQDMYLMVMNDSGYVEAERLAALEKAKQDESTIEGIVKVVDNQENQGMV